MKFLIIGGAGYIGAHVCLAFLEKDHNVSVLDNFSSGSYKNLPPELKIYEGDILDTPFLESVIAEGWDGIVHLAALKAAGESMIKPEKYARINISGTIDILNTLTASGNPPLVFSSSAAIFGNARYLPINEEHPTRPQNFYGHTKLEIEKLCKWYFHLKNLPSACLRYFNAAGYDTQGRITEPEKDPQNLLPILMENATGHRPYFTINGDDYNTADGTCIRDYIHVSDLADAHVLAMEHLLKSPPACLCLNLGSEQGLSVYQILHEVIKTSGTKFPFTVGPRRKGDPENLVATSSLAQKILGWKATRSNLTELVESTWQVYKQKTSKPPKKT